MQQPRDLGASVSYGGVTQLIPPAASMGLLGALGPGSVGLVPVGMALGHVEGAGMHQHSSGTVSNF